MNNYEAFIESVSVALPISIVVGVILAIGMILGAYLQRRKPK